MDDGCNLFQRLPGAGAGFGMHDAHNFGTSLLYGSPDFFRCKDFSEGTFYACDFGAQSFGDLRHAAAKHTIDADDHTVARLNQVDDTGFHSGTSRAADGHRHVIGRLKHFPQHGLNFIHEFQEVRVQVSHRGRCHRCQNTGMDLTWPWAHQNSLRRIEL